MQNRCLVNFGKLCLALALIAGCGSGSGGLGIDVPGQRSSTTSVAVPGTPAPGSSDTNPGTEVVASSGRIVINIPLVNARTVKTDVTGFRVTLSLNGAEFLTREFTRAEVQASGQQIVLEDIPAGVYDVRIAYLGSSGEEIGFYTQVLAVGGDQVASIDNPGYQNSKADFETLRFLPSGAQTRFYDAGDFNGDGISDLVYADEISAESVPTPGRLFIAIGTGDGYFEAPTERSITPSRLRQMVVGDLNRDGHLDIAASAVDEVVVLLGIGDGTFGDPNTFSNEGELQSYSLRIADLDGDQNPDLVTSNPDADSTSVFLGQGDGTFETAVNYSLGPEPTDVEVIDINGDNVPDLVAANAGGNSLSVLLGQGDGTFVGGSDFTVGDSPYAVTSADVNRDGAADLACANIDSVSVIFSNGSGGFLSTQSYQAGDALNSVKFGDVNSDGRVDIVASNGISEDFSILLGTEFSAFESEYRVDAFSRPAFASLDDLNGDGLLDIVATSFFDKALTISFGAGDGTFETPAPSFDVGLFTSNLKTKDLNGDGVLDLVTVNSGEDNLKVAMGVGDGSFATAFTLSGTAGNRALVLDDFNQDGNIDIASGGGSGLVVYFGKGDGTFTDPFSLLVPSGVAEAGDVNNDSIPDLIVGPGNSSQLTILLSNGDGTFTQSGTVTSPVGAWALRLTDFNNDGNLDLATLGITETVAVQLGNGDGTFGNGTTIPVPDELGGTIYIFLNTGDVDRDGNQDLLVAKPLDGEVSVLPGNGDGTFEPLYDVRFGRNISSILVEDVNGDGRDDILCGFQSLLSSPRPGITVRLRSDDGTFEEPVNFTASSNITAVVTGDFNNDGGLDVATADFEGAVTILLAR